MVAQRLQLFVLAAKPLVQFAAVGFNLLQAAGDVGADKLRVRVEQQIPEVGAADEGDGGQHQRQTAAETDWALHPGRGLVAGGALDRCGIGTGLLGAGIVHAWWRGSGG